MTSTEFQVGLDGTRVSSKVLKPPGGGSSDIFGLGGSYSTNGVVSDKGKCSQPSTTQSRLFGDASDEPPVQPSKTHRMQSNIFENDSSETSKPIKKKYVHRNPITGEEIEIDLEKHEKTENSEKDDKEEIMDAVPNKQVQTSIRVRNPPGGKSSGIF